jgi:hypothetical protein
MKRDLYHSNDTRQFISELVEKYKKYSYFNTDEYRHLIIKFKPRDVEVYDYDEFNHRQMLVVGEGRDKILINGFYIHYGSQLILKLDVSNQYGTRFEETNISDEVSIEFLTETEAKAILGYISDESNLIYDKRFYL